MSDFRARSRDHRARVLVVEDDDNLRLTLADNLDDEGFEVAAAANGAEARAAWAATPPDLIVLDIMLPDTDGYALCREVRGAGGTLADAMVLMLTARTLESDVVTGLDAGADDYLAKPYRLGELLARVRALLRRRGAPASAPAELRPDEATFAGFRIDRGAREIRDRRGRRIELTRTEFDLLTFLLDRRGVALNRDRILDEVWGREVNVDPRTVDNFVSNLKRKLSWTQDSEFAIVTVRGIGYRMDVGESP